MNSQDVEHRTVNADGIAFHTVTAGKGPTVILTAGFPQSWYAWRRVIPLLAEHFHVIAVDLPGQGDSDKPADGYDTETTARRLRSCLHQIGVDRYLYVGHDIGAWVGYPYAHHFGSEMQGLVLLDANIPGVTLPATLTLGPDNWRTWHFLFNSVPDLPEALLAGRERILIEWFFNRKTANFRSTFTREDIDEYERVYALPGGLRGMLGYYRAIHDDANQNAQLKDVRLQIPVLALGGDMGAAPDLYEKVKPLANDVRGGVITNSGHYIPEEQPHAVANAIVEFAASLGKW